MTTIKTLAKILGAVAAVYVFFRYLGGFSWQQSASLTLAGGVAYALYEGVNASIQVENSFSPYCVWIRPEWYQLLPQFKLITYQEEWRRLSEIAERQSSSGYSVYASGVFRGGIFFTVLRPPSCGLLHGLIYHEKSFLTELNISTSIVSGEDEKALRELGMEDPYFKYLPGAMVYFRRYLGDYEMGLEVDLDWWEQLCKSGEVGELAKVKQEVDHPCGTAKLAVATLPWSEFAVYYGERFSLREMAKLRESTDKQLEAKEWKRKHDPNFILGDKWSHAEHKYFTVSHRKL